MDVTVGPQYDSSVNKAVGPDGGRAVAGFHCRRSSVVVLGLAAFARAL